MGTVKYSRKLYKEFSLLVFMLESRSQMDRIEGRLKMRAFVEKHGKELCDAMFEELKREPV